MIVILLICLMIGRVHRLEGLIKSVEIVCSNVTWLTTHLTDDVTPSSSCKILSSSSASETASTFASWLKVASGVLIVINMCIEGIAR